MLTRIRTLLTAPTFEDEEKTRVVRLLNAFLLAFCGIAILVVAFSLVTYGVPTSLGESFTPLSGSVALVVTVGLLILARRGYTRLTSFLLLSMMWTIITGWICIVAGISSDGSTINYALIVVFAGLLLGGRAAIAFLVMGTLAILGAYYAENSGLLVVEPSPVSIMDPMLTIGPLFLTGFLLRSAVNSMANAIRRARENERKQTETNRELQAIRASLERRVVERTSILERRSAQLQAASEVGHAITSILETEQLIQQVAALIREHFGLYHVSLFLADEANEWATLRSASDEAGEALLPQDRQVRIGEGLVGWSIAYGRARVIREESQDMADLTIAELTDARVMAALPLHSRDRVLGALLVGSDRPDRLDDDAIAILENLTDQIAVALDNTHLFAESQQALEAARRAYGGLSHQAWVELLRTRPDWGYQYAHQAVTSVEGDWQPEMVQAERTGQSVQDDKTLAIPLRVRDEVVGALSFAKGAEEEAWTIEEMALLETLVDQLGVALESARLHHDTQRRAARDRLVSEIADKMRRAGDMDALLQATVREMTAALGTPSAFVQLNVPASQDDGE